jgi:hypothetical protein
LHPEFSSKKDRFPKDGNPSCASLVLQKWINQRPTFLLLRPQAKRMGLIDHKEMAIDAIFLLKNERIFSGMVLELSVIRLQ